MTAVSPGPNEKVAVVTCISDHEQERSVKAMIRSIRERAGRYSSCPVYVMTTDMKELPGASLGHDGVEVLPLDMDRAYLEYPLALKAFAAAQVERRVKESIRTLIWLDPGVIVLKSVDRLVLGDRFDAAVRPVTLANTIGIPPGKEPDEYWEPIYGETGIDFRKLPALTTVADRVKIQPYYNCEVYSFNPSLGLAREWARLLDRFLKDGEYQKNVCTTFLRKLFLHQAVLSAVISSRIDPQRIKPLPLTSGYPFNQHERLAEDIRIARMDDLDVVIFDFAWAKNRDWIKKIPAEGELKTWLLKVYQKYLEGAPRDGEISAIHDGQDVEKEEK